MAAVVVEREGDDAPMECAAVVSEESKLFLVLPEPVFIGLGSVFLTAALKADSGDDPKDIEAIDEALVVEFSSRLLFLELVMILAALPPP